MRVHAVRASVAVSVLASGAVLWRSSRGVRAEIVPEASPASQVASAGAAVRVEAPTEEAPRGERPTSREPPLPASHEGECARSRAARGATLSSWPPSPSPMTEGAARRAAIYLSDACYNVGEGERRGLEGRVSYSLKVEADGRVARADVTVSGTLPEQMRSCVQKGLRALRFEACEGGASLHGSAIFALCNASK